MREGRGVVGRCYVHEEKMSRVNCVPEDVRRCGGNCVWWETGQRGGDCGEGNCGGLCEGIVEGVGGGDEGVCEELHGYCEGSVSYYGGGEGVCGR